MIGRYYYAPTQAQRAQVSAALHAFKRRIHERRVERQAVPQLLAIGFAPAAAQELAQIHARLTA